ncbi:MULTISPECIES: FGGY-family carbohydrate kinase [Halomonadaceae]|uniref:FGGY-family carbohydrate kinase n=1 Tax=Modicisalibacter zincidurans TaxID=1178777 RepID=A0ABP9R6W8_9GAMM|nr:MULTISPECIES: FGGY-family carbohydrate kinase [Halomonas]MCD6007938.1 FGGY-family carbohydrate kinase [Halomonas sp. IOP_31]
METVIGIDIGTQSTKAVVIDRQGRILAEHGQGYRVDTPRPLWAEQWPNVWWEAVLNCIRACLEASEVDPRGVKGLCVSSLYGGSGIPVDAEIQPVHPCLIWMDRRAEAQVQWVKEHIDLTRLGSVTGNGVDSYYGFTKMMWLKAERPEIWKRTRYLLPPNSYINYRLSGEIAIDHSSAGNIGGVYDLAARDWSTEMLEALGLEQDKMPSRLVDSGATVGGLLPALADELGLPAGIPVIAGGVDAAMATLAAGATRPGNHVAMIGTSMCWGVINQHVDADQGLISMPHVLNGDRDLYTFGGALTAGASVSWFVDTLCGEDRAAAGEHGSVYDRLEPPARELPPGADGLLFLPYLMGERSPVWDARASACFIGLSLYHRRPHLYRAVLEGVTFALRHNMEAGSQQGEVLDPYLVVVGGATRSNLWMQIIADVTQLPVYTYREDVEAALGAGLLAGQAVDLLDISATNRHGNLDERATPDPQAAARYDELFALYCQLYPTLKPIMHRLSDAGAMTAH